MIDTQYGTRNSIPPPSANAIPVASHHTESVGVSPASSDRSAQRLLNVIFSGLILLLLFPVFAVIAILIKLDSPGPVLFIQKRVGKNGQIFPLYKFRSMTVEADAQRQMLEEQNERDGPVFKMRRDPRVTRVGRTLRRLSLDELPQLLNVVQGTMSLVGPRPALPSEVARYTPRQEQRLLVLPGVTGLWQVSGRSDLPFERSIELDMEYIEQYSFWLDVRILLRTVPAVLGGTGAY